MHWGPRGLRQCPPVGPFQGNTKGGTGSDSCCCCCISPLTPPPSFSPSPHIHMPAPSSPLAVHDRLGPAGPLARRHPHHEAPWSRGRQPSPPQNTPSLFRLLPNGNGRYLLLPPFLSICSLSLFFPLQVRRLCHVTIFFCSLVTVTLIQVSKFS